ncbi:MAG: hypothetical protein HGB12_18110 [Bacteroidetes bacterium]|nr:hypothetical protein [Bacteroidota bacterium]
MTSIESDIVEINNSSEKLFNFLSNLNNLKNLMPEQVINWLSSEDSCSFTIKGMTDLTMRIDKKIPYTKIIVTSGEKTPFNFVLIFNFEESKKNCTNTQIIFNAELNAMLEMLAKKPLHNFINMLVAKLGEIGEAL